jgi:hypothetical protein
VTARRGVVLGLWLAGVAMPAPAPAAEPPVRTVTALDGLVGALPSPRLVGRGGHRVAAVSTAIRLPAGSRQGHENWYLVRLDAVVEPRGALAAGGYALLSVALNGRTAVSVELRVVGGTAGRGVQTSTLDLIEGEHHTMTARGAVHVHSTNYAQLSAIRGGANVATVRLDAYGPAFIRRVRILPATSVLATMRAPSSLTIGAPRVVRIPRGENRRIGLRLRDAGDDARQVRLSLTTDPARLRVTNGTQRALGLVPSGRTHMVILEVTPISDQPSTLSVEVESAASQTSARILVEPLIAKANRWSQILAAILLLLPVGLAVWIQRLTGHELGHRGGPWRSSRE